MFLYIRCCSPFDIFLLICEHKVETLAQFGVVFLLFALGIEFNLSKMQGCQAVALGGGAIQIVISMFVGAVFNTVTTQGIFIGLYIFFFFFLSYLTQRNKTGNT